jgi:hypothetical protein
MLNGKLIYQRKRGRCCRYSFRHNHPLIENIEAKKEAVIDHLFMLTD